MSEAHHDPVKIGIVGKYFATGNFTLADSYLSVIESLKHAAWKHGAKPILEWLNAQVGDREVHAALDETEVAPRPLEGSVQICHALPGGAARAAGVCRGQSHALWRERSVLHRRDARPHGEGPGPQRPHQRGLGPGRRRRALDQGRGRLAGLDQLVGLETGEGARRRFYCGVGRWPLALA